jgi:hypothetical protein
MAERKRPPKPELKTFHATVLVARAEEWRVEVQTAEGAFAPCHGAGTSRGARRTRPSNRSTEASIAKSGAFPPRRGGLRIESLSRGQRRIGLRQQPRE